MLMTTKSGMDVWNDHPRTTAQTASDWLMAPIAFVKETTARKDYTCDLCKKPIRKGDKYLRGTSNGMYSTWGQYDYRLSFTMHFDCAFPWVR